MRFAAFLAALASICAAAPHAAGPARRGAYIGGGAFAAEFSGSLPGALSPPGGEPVKASIEGGWLQLDGVLLKTPTSQDYFARTLVEGSGGIAAWTDAGNAEGLTLSGTDLTLWRKANGVQTVLATAHSAARQVHLRFHCQGGTRYVFSYSENGGKTWTEMQPADDVPASAVEPSKSAVIALVGPGRFDFLRTKDVGPGAAAKSAGQVLPSKPAARKGRARRRR